MMMLSPLHKWLAGILSTLAATALLSLIGITLQLKEAVALLQHEMRYTQEQLKALTQRLDAISAAGYTRSEIDYRHGVFDARITTLEKECARVRARE
jgi:uncharacterized coiled-coil protein SlyX